MSYLVLLHNYSNDNYTFQEITSSITSMEYTYVEVTPCIAEEKTSYPLTHNTHLLSLPLQA